MNRVCLVDCLAEGGHATAARMLAELTGSAEVDCSERITWSIDNKYYKAEVAVEVREGTGEGEEWEAVITLCNLTKPASVQKAYSVWEVLGAETTPPVGLMVGVASGSEEEDKVRSEVVQWCLGRGVELVPWETNTPATQAEDNEEEDDFPESVGVARVSEALQAHVWPLMTLKSRPVAASGSEANCSHSEDRSQSSTTGNEVDQRTREPSQNTSQSTSEGAATGSSAGDTSQRSADTGRDSTASALEHGSSGGKSNGGESSQARLDSLLGASDLQLLENGLDESGDGSGEDFESLFAKFAQMKEHAQGLPPEERKAYAEKVVLSFWKAVGGDEEEVRADNTGSDSVQN